MARDAYIVSAPKLITERKFGQGPFNVLYREPCAGHLRYTSGRPRSLTDRCLTIHTHTHTRARTHACTHRARYNCSQSSSVSARERAHRMFDKFGRRPAVIICDRANSPPLEIIDGEFHRRGQSFRSCYLGNWVSRKCARNGEEMSFEIEIRRSSPLRLNLCLTRLCVTIGVDVCTCL